MTSAEPSFITKSLFRQACDPKAEWLWKLATKYWLWFRACVWVCSGLHFIPKPFHFSCPNKPSAVIAVWEHCIEHVTTYFQKYTVGIRRKPCLGASHLWKKHGCVGKPLWWAPTNAACKPVVNNRCLIVSAAALDSFRESALFSGPWWLKCRMLNRFMLLLSWVYDHECCFV